MQKIEMRKAANSQRFTRRANINFSVIEYLFQGHDHDNGDASPKDGAGQLTYYFAFPFFKFSSGALCNFNFQDFNPL